MCTYIYTSDAIYICAMHVHMRSTIAWYRERLVAQRLLVAGELYLQPGLGVRVRVRVRIRVRVRVRVRVRD